MRACAPRRGTVRRLALRRHLALAALLAALAAAPLAAANECLWITATGAQTSTIFVDGFESGNTALWEAPFFPSYSLPATEDLAAEVTLDPAIVGVMNISAAAYPDPDDPTGKFVRVKVKPVRPVKHEVSLKAIKADPELRRIPVVILTTSKAEEDIYRTYDLGANSYIMKPVTFDGLVEVMRGLGRYWVEIVELPGEAVVDRRAHAGVEQPVGDDRRSRIVGAGELMGKAGIVTDRQAREGADDLRIAEGGGVGHRSLPLCSF